MTGPALGTYVRPVGEFRYGYCLRVIKIVPLLDERREQWQCERWGMRNRHPVDDGHGHSMSYLDRLLEVMPGVWRVEWTSSGQRWFGIPRYFRRIDVAHAQRELF